MNDLLRYETIYWSNYLLILGIDEVVKGPLAGPLLLRVTNLILVKIIT